MTNHRLPRLDLPRLAVEGEGAHPFEAVRDLLFASSAFPGGFPPQEVPICEVDDGRPCNAARSRRVPSSTAASSTRTRSTSRSGRFATTKDTRPTTRSSCS
ncbi:MAG: hypothetical protein R3B99_16595 [Polyangiales bacterium]